MTSLAEEVKALVAMGIPPADALAAVTADRERHGSSSGNVSPAKSTSTSPLKMSNDNSSGSRQGRSRPGLPRPLSYNRPGMITHTHEESEVSKDRDNARDGLLNYNSEGENSANGHAHMRQSPVRQSSSGSGSGCGYPVVVKKDNGDSSMVFSTQDVLAEFNDKVDDCDGDSDSDFLRDDDAPLDFALDIGKLAETEEIGVEPQTKRRGSGANSKKFINKTDSSGVLESQRSLTAEFSLESSFNAAALLPVLECRQFWRQYITPQKTEQVALDHFLLTLKCHLTQEANIHKSEAKLCISSARKVMEKLDLNGNKQVSVLQFRQFLKPYGITSPLFQSLSVLRERDNKGLLFLAPPLPPRHIPLHSAVNSDLAAAVAQPGFTRVLGPAHSGKSLRVLSAVHSLPTEADCLWIDYTAEVKSESGAVSQLASELGLGGDNSNILRLFRQLLSRLSPGSVVVFDQIDSTKCAKACGEIFNICGEHHLSVVVISRTTRTDSGGDEVAPSIPFIDEKEDISTIHIGPLSVEEAREMTTVIAPSASSADNDLLAECAQYFPGNILALGTMSPTYLKQLSAVTKKSINLMSREASDILMRSFDDAQKSCAHCLAPLLHVDAYVSQECMWHLCEEMFDGNRSHWSDAINGLERMGWLRASLSSEDYIITGSTLPLMDSAPTLFKQCSRYCDYWAKQLTQLHDAHEGRLLSTSSAFQFDRYRSHFNRLLNCWEQADSNDNSSGLGSQQTSLASFGLLGSNYARDVAIRVAGKVATLVAHRLPPFECVDICCDIFTLIEQGDKASLAYMLASLDLARMLLLNNQLFDALELSTELVHGAEEHPSNVHSQQHRATHGAALSVQAQVYESLRQHENAMICYNKSVDSLGAVHGLESREYAIAEHRLGHVHRFVNDLKKAELCYKKALERFKTCHGNSVDHEDISCVLNDLAGIYKLIGESDRAFDNYSEVLRIRRKVLGEDHIETANSLNNLAVLLHAECKYNEAKEFYQDSLVIYKELLGDNDPDVAASLNNLGALHDDIGDFEEARSYYESSLVIRRAVLSEDHPDLAASLGNLAALLDDHGDIPAAKELYLQTLQVSRNIYGNEHVDIASTLVNIAALEDEQGHLAAAKGLYEEALSIFITLYTECHPDVASTLTCLANLAKLQHDHSSVRMYFDRILAIYKQLHGDDSVDVANAMTSYGVYLFKNGTTNNGESLMLKDDDDGIGQKGTPAINIADSNDSEIKHSTSLTVQLYEESFHYLDEALRIRRKILGDCHADVVTSLKNIGWLRKVQRHFAEAVACYEEALQLCEKMYDRYHPEVAECLTQLGVLNKFQDNFKEAISFFEEGIRIYQHVLLSLAAEDDDRKSADVRKFSLLIAANFLSLAVVHKSRRSYENSVECYNECLSLQTAQLGRDSAEVAKTLHALGLVTLCLGSEQASGRKLLEEALDIRRRILPDRHPDVIQSLNTIADLLGEDHKYNESMRTYADAISRIEQTVGSHHPSLAIDLLNMALMAYEMGKYNEAIPLFERGLAIRIAAYGDEHELVAEYLLAIANLHVAQRQFRESRLEFEGGLMIIEKTVGKESQEYATGLSDFAKCLQLMCHFEEAIPVINESLVLFRSVLSKAEGSDEGLKESERNSLLLILSDILTVGADVFVGCGDYASAEPYYEEAVEVVQKVLGDDNSRAADILMKLADVLKNQQFYDDSKNVYQEALQIRRQCLGIHLDVVQVLNNLGDLFKRLGELSDALVCYEEALVTREQILGEYHQDVAQSVHAVAAIYDLQGDFSEAERLFQRALLLRRKCLGDKHPDVAQTLNNLAAILDDLNRSDEAEPLYAEALLIYKDVYGDQHPDVALSLNNLAALLDDNGEFSRALQLYDEALVITRKVYGVGSMEVASAQLCLASALHHLKRFSEAENLFQHSLEIKIHRLGEDHLDVAATKVMYAELFVEAGELEDAGYLLEEAAITRENILGREHEDCVKIRERMSEVKVEMEQAVQKLEQEQEQEQGQDQAQDGTVRRSFIQTIHSMETAVERKRAELGPNHVAVADLLLHLANSLLDKDRFHDALDKLQEVLRIFRVLYSSDHPLVITTLDKVVDVLSSMTECEEALPLVIEVIETKAKVYGENSASLGESLAELGFIYDRLGELQKASEVYMKSLSIKRVTHGEDSEEVGQALNNLGAIMDDLGDSLGAEPYYREGLEIYRKVHGSDHSDVALSLNNLAALLDDRGESAPAKGYYQEALDISRRIFGGNSMEVASALIAVARTMKRLGEYEEAASHYEEATKIKESVLGPVTTDVALLYDQVGGMYMQLKWFDMSLEMYNKAYSIRQEICGPPVSHPHPDLALSLKLMSALYAEWGDLLKASELLEEALVILESHHGGRVSVDVADVLVTLATLARKNRKPRTALPLLNEALSTYRSCYGSKHAAVANTLCVIASIYKGFHKYSDALNVNRKALLVREVVEGDRSSGVAEILMSMGAIKEKQRLYDEAQSHYEDALSMYQEIYYASPNSNTAQAMTSLALVQKLQQQHTAAKEHFVNALEIRKSLYPNSPHLDIAQSMNNLAALLYSMHEYSEAKVLYEDSLEMLTTLLGTENLDVAQAMNNLAALLFAKKNHKEAEPLYQESLRIRRLLLGSHLDVASSLCNLGILKRSVKAYDQAAIYFEESLKIRMKILNDAKHPDVKVCKKHLAFLKQLSVVVTVGMRVEVHDRASRKVLTGEVIREHRNNLYDVKFDNPHLEVAGYVPRSRISVHVSLYDAAPMSPSKQQQGQQHDEEESDSGEDDQHARDRVAEDFAKAGKKVVRNSAGSRGSSGGPLSEAVPKRELRAEGSGSGGGSRSSLDRSYTSSKTPAAVVACRSNVSLLTSSSSSVGSSHSFNLSPDRKSSRNKNKDMDMDAGEGKVTSPGFTRLRARSTSQQSHPDDNNSLSKRSNSSAIVRHTSVHRKSSTDLLSVSTESSALETDGQTHQHSLTHNHNTGGSHLNLLHLKGKGGDETSPAQGRYREAVGSAGIRRSSKSFYKEVNSS